MNQTWKHVLLGDVFESITNGVYCDQKSNRGKQLVTRIETISKGVFDLERIGRADLTEKDLTKYRMKKDDILFSHINSPIHVGKTALFDLDEEIYHGVNLLRIRTIKEVEPKFLRNFLLLLYTSGFWRTVAKQSVNQASVNQKDISAVPFSYPPIEKQREIVKDLESTFAEIDLLEGNLAQIDLKAEQLVKSVFHTSIKALDVQPKSSQYSAPQGDAQSEQIVGTIDELCNVEYGTRVVRKKDAGTIYPVYGGGGETFFLDSFNRENRVVVARFAMSEKCTRRVSGKFALNDSGLTLSPKDSSGLRQDFLDYVVLGMNDEIYAAARGTAQKNLDVPAFRQMEISFPISSERQQKIVETLDRVFAEIELLRSQFKMQRNFALALRNSLLNAAFPEANEVA